MKQLSTAMVFAVAAFFLFSCNRLNGNTPEDTAKAFTEAFVQSNFTEAAKHATEASQKSLDMLQSMVETYKRFGKNEDIDFVKDLKGKKIEYSEPKMDGENRAAVSVMANGKEVMPLTLVKEKEDWKVAFDKATIMNTERAQ